MRAGIYIAFLATAICDPITKPYIAYLTSPFDQDGKSVSSIQEPSSEKKGTNELKVPVYSIQVDEERKNIYNGDTCPQPVEFKVHYIKPTYQQSNMAVNSPPAIIHGKGKSTSLLVLRHDEILDLIHLGYEDDHDGFHHEEDLSFPMLFQGSTFVNTSPLIMDINGDGEKDAIIVDYDGLITMVGIYPDTNPRINADGQKSKGQHSRFMKEIQIPRLKIRQDWVALSLTMGLDESNAEREKLESMDVNPHHSYFEYMPAATERKKFRGTSADPLQSHEVVDMRKMRHEQKPDESRIISDGETANVQGDKFKNQGSIHGRRLEERTEPDIESSNKFIQRHNEKYYAQNERKEILLGDYMDDIVIPEEDFSQYYLYDDDVFQEFGKVPEDRLARHRFYSDDQYVYIPPHVTSSPTYFEAIKDPRDSFENASFEDYVAIAVSYYYDEDEYSGVGIRDKNLGGDDSEAKRGQYVASALVVVNLRDPSRGKQYHLDLSTDSSAPLPSKVEMLLDGSNSTDALHFHENNYNGMGAFALSSPVVADLDGDGSKEAIVTTSMGVIHCINVPYGRQSFTVQTRSAIEHPVLIENVLGDSNLEIIAIDIEGNILCLDHQGKTLWHRRLLENKEILTASSELVYGDIKANANGILVTIIANDALKLFAIDAKDGSNFPGFPLEIVQKGNDQKLHSILKPLLMSFGTSTLILQAMQSRLYLIDTSTGCAQSILEKDEISSVQITHLDDSLALVGTFASGEVFMHTLLHTTLVERRPRVGILVDANLRKWQNSFGESIPFSFEIIDEDAREKKEYHIEFSLGRPSESIIFRKIYFETGKYTEKFILPLPSGRYIATIRLRTNDGKVYQSNIFIHFNSDTISYLLSSMILIPLLVTTVALLFVKKPTGNLFGGTR